MTIIPGASWGIAKAGNAQTRVKHREWERARFQRFASTGKVSVVELLEVWSEMLQNEPTGMLLGQRWTLPSLSGVCGNTREVMTTGLAGGLSPESEANTPQNPPGSHS